MVQSLGRNGMVPCESNYLTLR